MTDQAHQADHDAPHADADQAGAHDAAHGAGHGHDDHGSESELLGPVDWGAWGAGALGVAAGLLVVLCFVLATAPA